MEDGKNPFDRAHGGDGFSVLDLADLDLFNPGFLR